MGNSVIRHIVESIVGLAVWFGGIFLVSIILLVLVGVLFT